jgi:glycosyltransferase involved in cell wall biosynthesis
LQKKSIDVLSDYLDEAATVLISIVTVTYNADKTLAKLFAATQFVLEKYQDVEHVIVDGASTDTTIEIANRYVNSHVNAKFLSEPDDGIYNAMNKGLSLASGEYILHLNGDDWISDLHGFDAMYEILRRKHPLVLSSPVVICKGEDIYRVLPAKPVNKFHAKYGFHFPHQGTFFSRQVFKLTNGYNERIGYIADKIFCYQLLDKLSSDAVVFFDKVVFAQAMGGVSSRSSLTPIRTFLLTIKASRKVDFKNPMLRAFFNLVFKLSLFLNFY